MNDLFWNKVTVDKAIQAALKRGDDSGLLKAFKEASVPTISATLAEAFESLEGSEGSQGLLLKTLVEKALEIRPALLSRSRKDLKDYKKLNLPEKGVKLLASLFDSIAKSTGVIGNVEQELSIRLKSSFNDFNVSPLVRIDILGTPFDADALGDIELAEITKLDDGTLRKLDNQLHTRAKSVRNAAVKARLYLQAAKLLLCQPNAGDYLNHIYFYLSSYCSRQGEVFAEQQGRLDTAQDYLLECITHQRKERNFPTELYFRTVLRAYSAEFPEGKKLAMWEKPRKPSELVLKPYHANDLDAGKHIGLALMRLSQRDFDWAWENAGWTNAQIAGFFERALKPVFQDGVLQVFEKPRDIFLGLSKRYGSILVGLENLLKSALTAPKTLAAIASFSDGFVQALQEADAILRRREKAALKSLEAAAVLCKRAYESLEPPVRRDLLNQAKRELESAVETSSGLALGAIHISPIYDYWIPSIDSSVKESSVLIKPNVTVCLAKKTYSRRGNNAEISLEISNEGPGTAFNLDLQVFSNHGQLEVTLDRSNLTKRSACLASAVLDMVSAWAELDVSWSVKCIDADGRKYLFESTQSTQIRGAPYDIDFEELKLRNPFNAGSIVTDPKMFFGRERLIDRLVRVVIDAKATGALRILYGQRRVGKSSILYFLTEKLREQQKVPVIVASVSWLKFSTHNPQDVVYEIAGDLSNDLRRYGIKIPPPNEENYKKNYSFEFNKLLQTIFSNLQECRVGIFIDEFDKAFFQFSDPNLDYGEPFYSYLRGLSMTPAVTLILAGGELLPDFLRQLGPTFNNAKRERATYLDRSAIADLVRNEYVSWIEFAEAAVDRIFVYTQGNPFFSQMLGFDIVNTACELHSLEVSYADVDSVAAGLVAERLGPESVGHLYKLGDRLDLVENAIIYSLSQDLGEAIRDPWISKDTVSSMILSEPSLIHRTINHLVEREVIRRRADAPEMIGIVMPLFSAWYRQYSPLPEDAWRLIKPQEAIND